MYSAHNTVMIFILASTVFPLISSGQSTYPGKRDPLLWPFERSSIWNTPIGSGAKYVPAKIGPALAYGMTDDEDIIIMTPTAPLIPMVVNTAGWDGSKKRCGSLTSEKMYDIPVPNNFSTDPGYSGTTPNMGAAILMPDGKTIKQTQPFHRCGIGGTATSQYKFDDVDIFGPGVEGAHGGSGLSTVGGALRTHELRKGSEILHAMKINLFAAKYLSFVQDGTPGYRWPARNPDGYASENYGTKGTPPAEVEMGALLALLPEFPLDKLRTEPAKILAKAFQNYGAYIVDDTFWDVYAIIVEWGPNGRFSEEFNKEWGFPFSVRELSSCTDETEACKWGKDMADIFSSLQVVDNNSASSIGGGGVSRAPLAPDFGNPGIGVYLPPSIGIRRIETSRHTDKHFLSASPWYGTQMWSQLLGRTLKNFSRTK
ncbi:MAG: hypothetical protein M3Y08_18845 [Fibrobacterota bacterium]|nr:hypothetical protein [Fibrobacterota bacterium]